jgi:hypothetical protein
MATACALDHRGMRHPKIACNFLSHVTPTLGLLLQHDISIFSESSKQTGKSGARVHGCSDSRFGSSAVDELPVIMLKTLSFLMHLA